MTNSRLLRLLTCALLTAGLGACNSKNPVGPTQTQVTSAACTFTVGDAPAAPLDSSGGQFTIPVTTGAGCAWTASAASPFLTLISGSSGTGSGSVIFAAQSNAGSTRSGTVQVASRSLTISQSGLGEQTCEFAVTPGAATIAPSTANLPINVTATSGVNCPWTVTPNDAFLSVGSGASGTDNGTATLTVSANAAASARIGSATVAGRVVTILQEGSATAACGFSVAPRQPSIGAAGGTIAISVTKTSGTTCPWIASSQSSFVTISGANSGSGDGTVTLAISANGGSIRTGIAIVAGQQIDISQAAPDVSCQYSLSPTERTLAHPEGASSFRVTVVQGTNCAWTAQSQDSWIHITSGASNVGTATTGFRIDANSGGARTGTILLAGQVATVHQNAYVPCTFSVTPATHTSPSAGSSFTITVSVTSGTFCSWTATTSDTWVGFLQGQVVTGTGNGSMLTLVGGNPGAARSATVSVAGHTVTINQAAGTPAGGVAIVNFQSDPGDYIGGGLSQSYTFTGAYLTNYDAARGQMTFTTPIGTTPALAIRFQAPSGQPLSSSLYDHAQRWPVQTPTQPGLDVSWNSNACSNSSGRFVISDFSASPTGDVTRLHAAFEQHCEGSSAALRGTIWIDANGAAPPAPPVLSTPSSPTTFLTYTSDPLDVLGGGSSQTFTMANALFFPLEGQGQPQVSVLVRSPIGSSPPRQMIFSGGSAITLQPGTYNGSNVQLIGFGPCTSVTGTFTVLEASYGTKGDVYRFRATFELHCGAAIPALRGEVYIVADPWR